MYAAPTAPPQFISLVSTSNIDIVEQFLKAVKATVLKQISFGDIIKAGETRPC